MTRFQARPLSPASATEASEWIVIDTSPGDRNDGSPAIISHHNGRERAQKEADTLNRRRA
ncbi:hypothetical protein [Salinicola aestuarinus]|uniref:hypothetical protein n=1 Tax=Salinicola aestuarinus TaxID=1949082 RepID=UPI000DA18F5F|nr:hypothetical protein [Salinicola aestuarinus]